MLRLFFLQLVKTFFISDAASQNFMSVGTNTVYFSPIEQATDFTPIQGVNPLETLVLKDPVSGLVLDQSGGGDNLISWGMHGQSNQCFRLALGANDYFYLMSGDQCLGYDSVNKLFIRGSCGDNPIPLNVLFKLSYKRRREGEGLFRPIPRMSRHYGNIHLNPFSRTQSGFHIHHGHYHPIMMHGRV